MTSFAYVYNISEAGDLTIALPTLLSFTLKDHSAKSRIIIAPLSTSLKEIIVKTSRTLKEGEGGLDSPTGTAIISSAITIKNEAEQTVKIRDATTLLEASLATQSTWSNEFNNNNNNNNKVIK